MTTGFQIDLNLNREQATISIENTKIVFMKDYAALL